MEPCTNHTRFLFCSQSIVKDLEDAENNFKWKQDDIKKDLDGEQKKTKEIMKFVDNAKRSVGDIGRVRKEQNKSGS